MNRPRASLNTIITVSVAGMLVALAPASIVFEAQAQEEIAQIARALEQGDLESNWDIVASLERMGPDIAGQLKAALPDVGEKARLGFAKALIELNETDAGIDEVKDLLLGASSVEVRRKAAEILGWKGSARDLRPLKKELPNISDAYVKIAVAKALAGDKVNDRQALRELRAFLKFDDFSVRCEAAIALAELNDFESGRAILDQIRHEPSPRGRLANRLLLDEELLDRLEEGSLDLSSEQQIRLLEKQNEELTERLARLRMSGEGDPLLNEMIDRILQHHVDGDITREDLINAAAHGMVDSPPLDRFSSFMDVKETKKFYESIRGEYAGIGAVVAIDPDIEFLKIVKPIYSGPAYKEGLRAGDIVLEVEGISTHKQKVETMVQMIRGKPNTPVELQVTRRGWIKPRNFTIRRAIVELPVMHHRLLPGNIGYIHLLQFGERAHDDMLKALEEMEDKGMEALVFDLRDNQGGLLDQAIEVAGLFLNEQKTIVMSEGRDRQLAPFRAYPGGGGPDARPDYPLIILINENSASASEIVSGALQDHKRAILIGEKSYGKGSVQRPLRLESAGDEAVLKLTVAEYKLPSGRSIHEKGVLPDIGIFPDLGYSLDAKELTRLYEEKVFENYIADRFEANKEIFSRLAEYDGGKTTDYPDFDSWYESLDTKLDPEEIRWLLRYNVRNRVEDLRGSEFALDLQDDVQLQRAVVEALGELGRKTTEIEAFSFFPAEFEEFDVDDEYAHIFEKKDEAEEGGPRVR